MLLVFGLWGGETIIFAGSKARYSQQIALNGLNTQFIHACLPYEAVLICKLDVFVIVKKAELVETRGLV